MTNSDNWDKWSTPRVIALVQLVINTKSHTTTGYTPVELTFGPQAMHYFRKPQHIEITQHDDLDEFQNALDAIRAAAEENMTRAAARIASSAFSCTYQA